MIFLLWVPDVSCTASVAQGKLKVGHVKKKGILRHEEGWIDEERAREVTKETGCNSKYKDGGIMFYVAQKVLHSADWQADPFKTLLAHVC